MDGWRKTCLSPAHCQPDSHRRATMRFPERMFVVTFMLLQPLAWAIGEHSLDSMIQAEPAALIVSGVVWFIFRALKLMVFGFRW